MIGPQNYNPIDSLDRLDSLDSLHLPNASTNLAIKCIDLAFLVSTSYYRLQATLYYHSIRKRNERTRRNSL